MKCAIKYAPQNLSEIIYPSKAVETRIMGYANKQLENHLLLWGPNGTGKTSVADLLPYAIDGMNAVVESKHFEEVLGQKNLKEYLQNACSFNQFVEGTPKFYMVFHEFDNNSTKLNKLWTAMDDLSDKLMVIITTNEPMNIHKSVRDRCDVINFPALNSKTVLQRAQFILQHEGLVLPDQQVQGLLAAWDHVGSLRKYMGLLDELLFLHKNGLPIPSVPNITKASLKVVKKT